MGSLTISRHSNSGAVVCCPFLYDPFGVLVLKHLEPDDFLDFQKHEFFSADLFRVRGRSFGYALAGVFFRFTYSRLSTGFSCPFYSALFVQNNEALKCYIHFSSTLGNAEKVWQCLKMVT